MTNLLLARFPSKMVAYPLGLLLWTPTECVTLCLRGFWLATNLA
jgi:hypothetical protein